MAPRLDLRFVIGLFFSLMGIILGIAGFTVSGTLGSGIPSSTIDLACSAGMFLFGIGMVLASYLWKV